MESREELQKMLDIPEARREEESEKVDNIYRKRLEGLEDNRLVAEQLKDAGNVGWWGVYRVLQRKYVNTEKEQASRE